MVGVNSTCSKKSKKIIIIVMLLLVTITLIPINNSPTAQANVNTSSIVIEENSGRLLYSYNINAQLPMASTTKIVTALVVLKNLELYSYINIPQEAVGVEGSSIYLKCGERWRIIDLLYGLMLRSGNDAATALAIACGGSVDGFSVMMNDTAKSLGLKNSHFTNPHGLHNDEHYTSAYDLAMLTKEAFKYDIFKTIVSSKSYRFEDWDGINRVFVNKNKMLRMYDGGNGVKTGFTKKAGRCLVSSAFKDNMQVIAVTLNNGNMWGECMNIMNYAFNNYRMYELLNSKDILGEIPVKKSSKRSTMLVCNETLIYPLKISEISSLEYQLNAENVTAPIKHDEVAGNIELYLDKRLIFRTNVYTIEDIQGNGFGNRLKELVDNWR